MNSTLSTEFLEWMVYLDEVETEGFDRIVFQLAELTAEVRRSWVKDKDRVKRDWFLLKFSKSKKVEKTDDIEEKKTKGARSESIWNAIIGAVSSPRRKR